MRLGKPVRSHSRRVRAVIARTGRYPRGFPRMRRGAALDRLRILGHVTSVFMSFQPLLTSRFSRTTTPCYTWLAPSCSNCTTSGSPSRAATCPRPAWTRSTLPNSPQAPPHSPTPPTRPPLEPLHQIRGQGQRNPRCRYSVRLSTRLLRSALTWGLSLRNPALRRYQRGRRARACQSPLRSRQDLRFARPISLRPTHHRAGEHAARA